VNFLFASTTCWSQRRPASSTSGAFIASGRQFGLTEVLQLVRRYAAEHGACCVAKLLE
jgi:hypothetical protein